MKNIKDEFMENERKDIIEGEFLVALNNGITFLCKSVWRMKTSSGDHFRFYRNGKGESRIEPERVETIIEVNA